MRTAVDWEFLTYRGLIVITLVVGTVFSLAMIVSGIKRELRIREWRKGKEVT